jgi:urea-proton symporter
MACGFAVWFGTAYHYSGEITIVSTGQTLPCIFGCLASSFVPLPITLAISFIWPSTFEWEEFLKIKQVTDTAEHSGLDKEVYFSPEKVKYMKRISKIAAYWAVATFLGQIVLWPLPMYGAKMIFGRTVSLF